MPLATQFPFIVLKLVEQSITKEDRAIMLSKYEYIMKALQTSFNITEFLEVEL